MQISSNIAGCPLLTFDTLPSTNTYLKEHADELPDRTVVTADLQSCGKGRLGNTWLATRDMLPVSMLIKAPDNAHDLTVICAVAVCRAIERLSGIKAGIKWTNDIICSERKVCGILCESTLKSSCNGAIYNNVICGMGLNVNQDEDFFEKSGLVNAASLYTLTGNKYDKMLAAEYIVDELTRLIDEDFSTVINEYSQRCVTLGKTVKLVQNNTETTAFAKAIAPDGCLICENENGEFTVNSGLVRVRGVGGEYV